MPVSAGGKLVVRARSGQANNALAARGANHSDLGHHPGENHLWVTGTVEVTRVYEKAGAAVCGSGIDQTNLTLVGSGTNVDNGNDASWATPGNITADDGSTANAAIGAGGGTDYLRGSSLGFSLGGAEVTGVEAEVQRIAASHTLSIGLTWDGVPQGSAKTLAAGAGTEVVGGPTDMWGLTPSELSGATVSLSTFGTMVWRGPSTPGGSWQIDYVKVRVYTRSPAVNGVRGASVFIPGGTVYQKAGFAVVGLAATGADASTFAQAGAAVAAFIATGADASTFSETGAAVVGLAANGSATKGTTYAKPAFW
jgi:hypothetical protein